MKQTGRTPPMMCAFTQNADFQAAKLLFFQKKA